MKWILFGLAFFALFGCMGIGEAPQEEGQAPQQEPEAEEHLVIGEGEGSVVTEGEVEEPPEAMTYESTPSSDMYVYFFNVGDVDTQGDAVLVKKGDAEILVDAGPYSKRQELVTMMLEAGVDDIELAVSTHEDPEHYGGFEYVSERFGIGELWRPEEGSESYASYLDGLGAERTVIVGKGDSEEINGISITVLNPIKGEDRFFDENNDAIVLKIEDRGLCILLTSDILGAQQGVAQDAGECQVLQWPNHGMSEGLTEVNWLMDHTKPEVIVISGSERDWTDSRQSLKQAAHLGGVRDIPILENYDGKWVKIMFDGDTYYADVES
jgi:beta-lactamase superfamily II metal-dependent hydrolase